MEKKGSKKQKQQKQQKQVEEIKESKHQQKTNKNSKSQQQQQQNSSQQPNQKSVYEKNGKIYIVIRAKPGSKQDEVYAVEDDFIGVAVQAPPLDGEANEGILEYLASIIGLKKRDLTLVRGQKSHDKLVQIDEPGQLNTDQVLMKLLAAKS